MNLHRGLAQTDGATRSQLRDAVHCIALCHVAIMPCQSSNISIHPQRRFFKIGHNKQGMEIPAASHLVAALAVMLGCQVEVSLVSPQAADLQGVG